MISVAKTCFAGALAVLACLPPLVMVLSRTAAGQEYCSKPVAPYCVDADAAFDTTLQVNSCRRDLENYEEQLADYEQCIADQIETMHQELSEAKEALEKAKDEL